MERGYIRRFALLELASKNRRPANCKDKAPVPAELVMDLPETVVYGIVPLKHFR